jgi:hypothetical protein
MKTKNITFTADPETRRLIEALNSVAEEQYRDWKESGNVLPHGKGRGFKSAVIRACIQQAAPSIRRALQEQGISYLV